MQRFNAFLQVPHGTKGGGLFLEDVAVVENIACQTSYAGPGKFETDLADKLMEVFAAGCWELEQIVPALNEKGSRDLRDLPWTEASLREQLSRSAAGLFAQGTAHE